MTINTRIEGILRLKTPLHCASSDEASEANMTLTMKQPVVSRIGGMANLSQVAYFPANDLGGRLRREGARAVMDSFVQRGIKVGRELYTGLASGSAGASPDTSSITVEEVMRGRGHVFQGTFGGGARMLRKMIRPSDLYPIIAATVDAGAVPERFASGDFGSWVPTQRRDDKDAPVDGWKLIHKPQMLRLDDIMLARDPQSILTYIENALEVVASHQTATTTQRAERADSKAASLKARETGTFAEVAKKQDVGNIYTVEAIAAGTAMYFRLDLEDQMTDAQVGLVARCVQALVNRQDLGGLVRNGYGRYSAELVLTRNDVTSKLLAEREGGEGYDLAGEAVSLQDATSTELDAISIEEMMSFYMPREKKARDPKAGKGAEAVAALAGDDEAQDGAL